MRSPNGWIYLGILCGTIGAWQAGTANERPRWFVHRVLECGSVRVTSDTKLLDRNDVLEPRGLSQRIRLTDMSTHRSVTLPIFQRISKSKRSDGRNILDGLVWAFDCATSSSGETYVMLEWSCTNPDSKTCQSAMDIRDEWDEFFDRHGNPLPDNPWKVTPADVQRIKQLGLWPTFIQNDLDKTGGFTYFYKQVDPNGHIK